MSPFADSLDNDSVPQRESTHPFDNDDNYVVDHISQQFDSFSAGDHVFESQPPIYGEFSTEENRKGLDGEFGGSDGPILPPPSEMEAEEGVILREWRRQNAMQLGEKEKREKEMLSQIIEEAEAYKVEFYRKREITCENSKATNREKEKLFLVNHEKFHAEADKSYWKAIADLIPNEVPAIEKKKGKKDQEKKPGIIVIQGPKPGKPAELSRMRQILLKLKHNNPPHLNTSPKPDLASTKDTKNGDAATASTSLQAATVVTTPEAVAVA